MIPRIFIFEGLDGCGKTTQCQNLKNYLSDKGIKSLIVREPGGTICGEYIRSWLKSDKNISPENQLLLFCLARKEICNYTINTILNTDNTIILDRFMLSTYCYQGVNLSSDIIKEYHKDICPQCFSIMRMAKLIYLDITAEEAIKRINSRGIDSNDPFENIDYLKKVRDLYLRKIDDNLDIIVDGSSSQTDVWNKIKDKLDF